MNRSDEVKEALSICVAALRDLTSNDNVYDDDGGRDISFDELARILDAED